MRVLASASSILCLFAAYSCSSTTQLPDAGQGSAAGASALLAELARSRQAWNALAEAMGGTYSYAEENCVYNSIEQGRTLVEVRDGVASKAGFAKIAPSDCAVFVNRYDDFVPKPLPSLYDECERLIRALGNQLSVSFDEHDVLQACFVTDGGNGGDCYDACGSGFFIRDLTFELTAAQSH